MEAGVACARCGHEHEFFTVESIDATPSSMRCSMCGFLFLEYMRRRIAVMTEMLEKEPEWVELIRSGNHAGLIQRIDAIVPPPTRVELPDGGPGPDR